MRQPLFLCFLIVTVFIVLQDLSGYRVNVVLVLETVDVKLDLVDPSAVFKIKLVLYEVQLILLYSCVLKCNCQRLIL